MITAYRAQRFGEDCREIVTDTGTAKGERIEFYCELATAMDYARGLILTVSLLPKVASI